MISDIFLFLYDAVLLVVAFFISIFLVWMVVMFPFVVGAYVLQAYRMTCNAKNWCKKKIFGDPNALDRRHRNSTPTKRPQE